MNQRFFPVRSVALVSALVYSLAAHGEPAPSLAAVIEAGFERYPQRTLGTAVRHEGEAIRRQASGLLAADPALSIRHENDAYTDDAGFRNWEGGLEMPLWLPGQRSARRQLAQATEAQADGLAQASRWKVAGELRELLWSLRIAQTEVALSEQALHSAETLQSKVSRKFHAGELARTDKILAEKETLARRAEQLAARANLNTSMSEYRTWTGLDVLPMAIEEQPAAAADALDAHPALIMARLEQSRVRAERNRVLSERRANPVLTLGGRSEKPESGMGYDTALVVQVDLPLGTPRQAAVSRARAERALSEADVELADVRRKLDLALERATYERQSTQTALALAKQQYDLAAEGLRLTERAFELGESDLFTLLQARGQALAAERTLRLHELELGRSIARYNQALGVIPK